MEKAEHVGDMRFCFDDYRENKFNESVDCTFAIWETPETGMDIELYWCMCRQFAAAMGFAEETIAEWFGA